MNRIFLFFIIMAVGIPTTLTECSEDELYLIKVTSSGLIADGTNPSKPTIEKYTGYPVQLWRFERGDHAGLFYIINNGSGLVFDFFNCSHISNGNLRCDLNLVEKNNSLQQQWFLNSNGRIVNAQNLLVLDVYFGDKNNNVPGTKLDIYKDVNRPVQQQFTLQKTTDLKCNCNINSGNILHSNNDNGNVKNIFDVNIPTTLGDCLEEELYSIKVTASGLVVDGTIPTILTIEEYTGYPEQLWRFQKADHAGLFHIINNGSGLLLDVNCTSVWCDIHLSERSTSLEQQWFLNANGRIVNAKNLFILDVYYGDSNNNIPGTKLAVFGDVKLGSHQQFSWERKTKLVSERNVNSETILYNNKK